MRAELAEARSRISALEQELTAIVSSPTWQLASRLRAWKRRVTSAGPLAPALAGLIRAAQIAANEGPRGVRARAARRLRGMLFPSKPLATVGTRLPRTLSRVDIPSMTHPEGVSIVIPVFNKVNFTYHCLDSVARRSPEGRYEVIVVDNASSDETPELLAQVGGLRVIRNEVNRGFVDACNQGAKEARGRFLLFLNNDTVVLDGWLLAMLDTLADDPTVGAVGAQLLYPDGRLQEAGAILWNDGTAWNYGRGDDRHRPEYLYRREVDYCSGACLLVRRELFEQIGGFDARYAPAYYEDTDLCFAVWRLGYRVVYQPKARIVHFEGGTAGTDVASGFKRFQEINRRKFLEKHAATLATQPLPHPARVFRARDRRPGLRILLVDHMVPLFDRESGSVRMLALLRLLGELGHAVTFVPDNLTPFEPYTDTLQQLGVEVLYGDVSIGSFITQHLQDFDVAIFCRAPIAGKYLLQVAALPGRPAIVFDTVDLHYLREQRGAVVFADPALAREAALIKTAELTLARASDQVWVVSEFEADLLRQEDPSLSIAIVPNIHSVRPDVPPFAERRDLLFIGGFRHPPNGDAVRYFVGEILPLVKQRLPDVRLIVVGPDVPPAVLALDGPDVLITGQVPEVEPVFDRCRVFVAPLRFGAGLKGKVGQSLACGLPLVTTSIGAEGMQLVNGEHALIADTPADFAARVAELYTDPVLWTRLSERGRRHVDARFGPATVRAALAETLAALGRRR